MSRQRQKDDYPRFVPLWSGDRLRLPHRWPRILVPNAARTSLLWEIDFEQDRERALTKGEA